MHSRPVLLRILISSSMRPGSMVNTQGNYAGGALMNGSGPGLEIISTLSYLSFFFKLFLYIRRLLYQEFILASVR
jgi:hypothetical protein